MRRSLHFFLAILLLALTVGCGSMGRNFDDTHVVDIKNNATTKAEILEWFGLPFKEGVENDYVMWTYQIDKYMAGHTHSKDLVLLFDANNVVKAYRYTKTADSD